LAVIPSRSQTAIESTARVRLATLPTPLHRAAMIGPDQPTEVDVDVRDCRGAGFGVAGAADRAGARLALRCEGLLLDDYYGAKAMTLLRNLLAGGAPTPAGDWHTGGIPAALAALREWGTPA